MAILSHTGSTSRLMFLDINTRGAGGLARDNVPRSTALSDTVFTKGNLREKWDHSKELALGSA